MVEHNFNMIDGPGNVSERDNFFLLPNKKLTAKL